MIYSFIDITEEGLNVFAYTEALRAYYDKEVTYYMEIDYTDDLLATLNDSQSIIREILLKNFNDGKIIVYYKNEFFDIILSLRENAKNETIIYPQSFLDRYGKLKIFNQTNEISIPILLAGENTIFEPLNNIIIPTDFESYTIENKSLIKNLAKTFDLELIFSHIYQPGENVESFYRDEEHEFFQKIEQDFKGFKYSFRFEKDESVQEGMFKVTKGFKNDYIYSYAKKKKDIREKTIDKISRAKHDWLRKMKTPTFIFQSKGYGFSYN